MGFVHWSWRGDRDHADIFRFASRLESPEVSQRKLRTAEVGSDHPPVMRVGATLARQAVFYDVCYDLRAVVT